MAEASSLIPRTEKFENAALFLRLGLPSTLIRDENGALHFSAHGKHFENGASRWKTMKF